MNKHSPVILSISGFLLIIFGFLCSFYILPVIEKHLLQQKLALKESNLYFEIWKNNTYPIKFKIYIFNVTNPKEVQNGERAIVQEIGPYVYNEYKKKNVLSINEDADTITYTNSKTFYFNWEESVGSDEDIVTIINFDLLGIIINVLDFDPTAIPIINRGLPFLYERIEDIFLRISIRNLFFQGFTTSCNSDELDMICGIFKVKSPPTVRQYDEERKYVTALMFHLNGTTDGPFVMQRGIKTNQKGKITSYKNEDTLLQWGGDSCNSLNGTDLSANEPLPPNPDFIYFFLPEICRSLRANFLSELKLFGITAYKFTITEPFGGPQEEPDCFCVKDLANNPSLPLCSPLGTMDSTPCTETPIVISLPHFHLGLRSLTEYIKGMQPDEKQHQTEIFIEPRTGTVLTARIRLQYNIPVKMMEGLDVMKNIKEGLFPIYWFEEETVLHGEIVERLREGLEQTDRLHVLKWGSIFGGVLMTVSGFFVAVFMQQKKLKSSFNKSGGNLILGNYRIINK